MSQELAVKGYYQNLYDSNFLSTNLGAKLGMEFFLSTLLFKGDLSRVVYSKEDIAFRRRVELLGNGTVKDMKFNYIALDMPFAVYSQSGNYEEDDRGSTQNVGQIVLGKVEPESGLRIKAAAVKVEYEATIFCGRRDDVNVISQLLYWEKTPKFPVYFGVEHEIHGHPISIPFYITLDSFDSNVDYADKDWLEKSKIYPIKCKFTIRSYQTLIENLDKFFDLPIRFSGLYACNNEEIVYTQKTTLLWADQKWSVDDKGKEEWDIETENSKMKLMPVHEAAKVDGNQDVKDYGRGHVEHETNEVVKSAVEGYLTDDIDCTLDEFFQDMEKTTENEINIHWLIKESSLLYFKAILIYIPGICNISVDDPTQNDITVSGLYPGSKYDCTIITISKANNKLTYKLSLKTRGEPVLGKTLISNLIGKTFTGR